MWPRSRRTRMLECQRNGESSFAVSASTCIRRNDEGGGRQEGQEVRDRGRDGGKYGERKARAYVRARRCWVCPGAVCRAHSCDLQLMKLRVQSRRMSNKYVSRRPSPSPCTVTLCPSRPPGRTTCPLYPLHPLPSQPLPVSLPLPHLVALLRADLPRAPDRCRQPTPSPYPPPPPLRRPAAYFNPLACSSSLPAALPPIRSPFRLQDGLIRHEIIVPFARTCS